MIGSVESEIRMLCFIRRAVGLETMLKVIRSNINNVGEV